MLIDLSFYCRACEWCRVHCRNTQTFPVVPRHSLVSCISVPDSMERYKTHLKAPKCLISLITLFFGTPCKCFILQPNYCNRPAGNQTNFPCNCKKGTEKLPGQLKELER